MCYKDHTTLINPIIDWTTDEVWEFIREYKIPYCSLYDEGFKRLGCIGCPMGTVKHRTMEFERWPKYKNLYLIAFGKMIENRGGCCVHTTRQTKRCNGGLEMADSRASDARIHNGELQGANADWTDMTPEEIMEWWIA